MMRKGYKWPQNESPGQEKLFSKFSVSECLQLYIIYY
jgi:hypothetical protein